MTTAAYLRTVATSELLGQSMWQAGARHHPADGDLLLGAERVWLEARELAGLRLRWHLRDRQRSRDADHD